MNFFSPSYSYYESLHLQTAKVTCKIIVALHLVALVTAVLALFGLKKRATPGDAARGLVAS
jgi:hypothetical protein